MIYSLITINLLTLGLLLSIFKVKNFNTLSVIFTTIFFSLIFGFREGVLLSTDLDNYLSMYNSLDLYYLDWSRIEPGYLTLQLIFKYIGIKSNTFLTFVSFIQVSILVYCVKERLNLPFVAVLLFFCTPFLYNFSANTIRQGLAFSILLFSISINYSLKRWLLLMLVGFSFHFSVLVCFVFIYVFRCFYGNKKILLYSLVFSPLLFFLPFEEIILQTISMLPSVSSLGRSVEYVLLASAQDGMVTGRFFYLVSFILIILTLINFKKIEDTALIKFNIKNQTFFMLVSLAFFGVISFPVFSGIGYLVRFSSYGLAIFPLLLFLLLRTKFNSLVSNLVSLGYVFTYMIYSKSLFIYPQ